MFFFSASEPAAPGAERITVSTSRGNFRLPLTAIDFVRADHVYVNFHLAERKRLVQRTSLAAIEEQLPADKFLRVHRSFIVNLDRIVYWTTDTIMIGEFRLPISRKRRKAVLALLKRR